MDEFNTGIAQQSDYPARKARPVCRLFHSICSLVLNIDRPNYNTNSRIEDVPWPGINNNYYESIYNETEVYSSRVSY